MMYMNTWTD